MAQIDKDLHAHICKDCAHLDYYDWYFCRLDRHNTDKGFLDMCPLKHCDGFSMRLPKPECLPIGRCVMWCNDCLAKERRLKKHNESTR